jgi:hypothetical protein
MMIIGMVALVAEGVQEPEVVEAEAVQVLEEVEAMVPRLMEH